MFALMTIKELYRNFLLQLQRIYPLGEATMITDWVFEKIAAVKRHELVKDPSLQLHQSTIKQLHDAFVQLEQHNTYWPFTRQTRRHLLECGYFRCIQW